MKSRTLQNKLYSLGIRGFPASEASTYKSRESLTLHRQKLYLKVAESIPSNAVVYYAGSGADPLPRLCFGRKIIYGSLREADYFEMLKGSHKNRPQAYKHITDRFRKLNGIYANAMWAPLSSGSVKVLVTHYSALAMDSTFLSESYRILSPGGILMVGENNDVFWHSKLRKEVRRHGFAVHPFDKFSRPVNTHYWGYPYGKGVVINGTPSMLGICRNTFISKLNNGEVVRMDTYLSHVFYKQS